MTIATKSGGLIVKDGRLAENCACCANCNAELLAKVQASNFSLKLEISIKTSDETWNESGQFTVFQGPGSNQVVSVGRTWKLPAFDISFSRTVGNGLLFSGSGPTIAVWNDPFTTNRIESNDCSQPSTESCVKRLVKASLECLPDQSIRANVAVDTHTEQKWNVKTTTSPQNFTLNGVHSGTPYTATYTYTPTPEFEVMAPIPDFDVTGILGPDLGTISGSQSILAGRYPSASFCPGCNSNLPAVFSGNIFVHGTTARQFSLNPTPPSFGGWPLYYDLGPAGTGDPVRLVPYDMTATLSWVPP